MEGPQGVSKVKMHADKSTGLPDHGFIVPNVGNWQVPCRVVPAGDDGAHFIITFTKPASIPDEVIPGLMLLLDEELQQLKTILESGIS